MITLPEGSSVPVQELIEYLNKFLPALFQADNLRGEERVTAVGGHATEDELVSVQDAIKFAMK